jgi:hypothetical protein
LVAAIGAADGEDPAKQAAIMLLQQEGMRIDDEVRVSRI